MQPEITGGHIGQDPQVLSFRDDASLLSNEIVRFAKVIPPHALSQWFGPLPAFVKWGCLRACKLWFFKIPLLFNFCLCISCQSYQKQVIQCLPHAVYVVSLLVAAFGLGFIHMFIHQPGL